MTPGRGLALAVASVLLASACTSDAGNPSAGTSDASASPSRSVPGSPAATEARIPPAPERGACYRLRFDQLTEPTNGSRTVPCSKRHDAQTIHVGRLDTVVDGHAVTVDSDRVIRQLSTECPRRLAAYVGGGPQERRLSRIEVVWFSPTLEQSDRGADWFRCDVVALAGGEALFRLPPPRRLKGLLDSPRASTYSLCGTAAPGERDFSRVICGRRHSWRAVATIAIPGGKAYPGTAEVRDSGDEACRDRVRSRAEDPLKFRYGWEWPTREQWNGGQHFGYCWAPD